MAVSSLLTIFERGLPLSRVSHASVIHSLFSTVQQIFKFFKRLLLTRVKLAYKSQAGKLLRTIALQIKSIH